MAPPEARLDLLAATTLLVVLALGACLVGLLLATRRSPDAGAFAVQLEHLHAELGRLARNQEELRREVQRSRESSLVQVSEAAQALRTDIGQAHRALAEVKALERARTHQMDRAADSLRRLEAVVAGSATRGAAGENILARALGQLPPDLIEFDVAFGSRVVEYALRLPGGRLLPIDSKWTSLEPLAGLETEDDPRERRRLAEQVARDVRARVREVRRYLDPDRTLGLALLAVPDAVHQATHEAQAEAYREGVLVVPYSLALPYVLALYRLTVRFGTAGTAADAEALRAVQQALWRADEEVEGRLARAAVQVANSRSALHDHLAAARRSVEEIVQASRREDLGGHDAAAPDPAAGRGGVVALEPSRASPPGAESPPSPPGID